MIKLIQSGRGRGGFVCQDWACPYRERIRIKIFGEDEGEVDKAYDIEFSREAQGSAALNRAANNFSDSRLAKFSAFSGPNRFDVSDNARREETDHLGLECGEMFFSEFEHGEGD